VVKIANKLFIPGPTEVRKEILNELAHPQIGHRTAEFKELFGSLKPGLKKLFYTENDVLLSTSSGSGFWEASIRSCVNKKVLHAINGAFSNKWASLSERCGREAETLIFDDGKAVSPEVVDEALSDGEFEAFCMVHNESSSGVLSNLEKISKVMKKHPDVLWFVDAVSSLGGVKIETDKLGIDICLASVQKAIALPAGFAVASISPRSYEKAKNVEGRGYYFDILELKKSYDKNMTPYTPSIPHLYALKKQLEKIEEEGLENRFKRHKEMASYVREWAKKNGFETFSEEGCYSETMTCLINNKEDVDFKEIKIDMAKKGYSIDSGYGKMNTKLQEEGKNPTFRIAHMGDLTLDEIKEYLSKLEEYWK